MDTVTSILHDRMKLATALCLVAGIVILGWHFGIAPALSAPDAGPSMPALEEPGPLNSLGALEADAAPEGREQLELPDAPAAAAPPSMPDGGTITAYITGAVRAPDVYTLPAQARVKDLVQAAGGLADDADAEHINLAAHLKDEEHVSVPHQGDVVAAMPDAPGSTPGGTHVATNESGLIDINTASAAELEALDGIGTVLSQRIVEYRVANGPFASAEDLLNVKGIGSKLFDDIAPAITVGPT